VFKAALASSPTGKIDIVIANAGISGGDSVYFTNSKFAKVFLTEVREAY
jgi:NAD(P)-dependent dehydrogenase (short-subunit alcohol dehydrogenase family)